MTVTFDKAKTLLTDTSPCYTLDDVEHLFGVRFRSEHMTALENIPFSRKVLKTCAGTHMLFPGFPLSLLDVRTAFPGFFYSQIGGWYAHEKFASIQVQPVWHLLRMQQVPYSLNKTWNDQQSLLLPDEEVPSAALVTYASMLHFGATKQRLFERCFVRTSDVDAGGSRVRVGAFNDGGFLVSYCLWDDACVGLLGVASARKSS